MASQNQLNNILKKHSSAFTALEEFEKTGRTIVKSRLNFTIDRDIAKQFRNHCKVNRINMSSKIEEAIKELLQFS